MDLSEEDIREMLHAFFLRCEMARAVGGIPMTEVTDARSVPFGWILDWDTHYFLPPNCHFSDEPQRMN